MLRDRRVFLTLLAGAVASPVPAPAWAQAPGAQSQGMSKITAFAFHFAGLSGGDIQLAEYAGKPILVVNTASQCGTASTCEIAAARLRTFIRHGPGSGNGSAKGALR